MSNWEIGQLIKRLHLAQGNGPGWQDEVDRLRRRLKAVAAGMELFADWKPWSDPAEYRMRRANDIRWALLPIEV